MPIALRFESMSEKLNSRWCGRTDSIVKRWYGCFSLLVLIAWMNGCASYDAGVSQPAQEVHVLGTADVANSMQQMGEHLFILTALTLSDESEINNLNTQVMHELNTLSSIARDLAGPGQITNYSMINRYMSSFHYDVQLAMKFASRTPPNYVPANRLIKSCMACHESF